MNYSLSHLILKQSLCLSPYLQLNGNSIHISKSSFTNFFNHFLKTRSNINLQYLNFDKFLNSPINFDSQAANTANPTVRRTLQISGKDANISHCKFSSCLNSLSSGGAISYKNDYFGKLMISRCAFAKCFAQQNGGGIFATCEFCDISSSCFHECTTTLGFGATLFLQTKEMCSIFLTTFRKETKATRNTRHLNLFASKQNKIFIHNNNATNVLIKYGAIYSFLSSYEHEISSCYFSNSSVDSALFFDDVKTNVSIIHSIFKYLSTRHHIFDSTTADMTAFAISSLFQHIEAPKVKAANLSIIFHLCYIPRSAKNSTCPGVYIDCVSHQEKDIINMHIIETYICWDEDPNAFELPKKYQKSKTNSFGKKKTIILGVGLLFTLLMLINIVFVCYKCGTWIYKTATSSSKKKQEPAELFIKEIAREKKSLDGLEDIPKFSQVDDDNLSNEQ